MLFGGENIIIIFATDKKRVMFLLYLLILWRFFLCSDGFLFVIGDFQGRWNFLMRKILIKAGILRRERSSVELVAYLLLKLCCCGAGCLFAPKNI